MVKIKFKEGPNFSKLLLVKYVCQTFGFSLKEGKDAVESGVIECPDHAQTNAIKKIAECGGIQMVVEEMKPLPDDAASAQKIKPKSSISIKPNKNGTGLIIESCAPISEHTFQDLEKNHLPWIQIATSIPFVAGLTQLCEKETNKFWSLLAVEVPESHNTVNEIVSLSKMVDEIHSGIIGIVYKFHNLAKDFNSFIDDVEVETRLDNSN